MVNNQGIIIHKTNNKKWRRHDYTICKKNHPVTQEVISIFDLGYLGIEKDLQEQLSSSIPNRKKRNLELSQEEEEKEKEYNKSHSRKRG